MATVVPGEAPETDDDCDDKDNGHNESKEVNNTGENDEKLRNRDFNEVQQRSRYLHVDEKLEERWLTLGYDTARLAKHQAFTQRKQFENLKQNLFSTQHAIQVISSTFRQVAGNLEHVERNLSLLQDGAKLMPDFSTFSVNSNCSSSKE